MVKKIFFYFIFSFTLFLFISTFISYTTFEKLNNKIFSTISTYQYNSLFNQNSKYLELIKSTILNYYQFTLDTLFDKKIDKAKEEAKFLISILDILHIKDYEAFLFEYVRKNSKHLIILNSQKIVIASHNILDVGKKLKLPCNPIENFGICEIKNKKEYSFIIYYPKYKIYIISKAKAKILQSDIDNFLNQAINILKATPDIIIYKDHLIKGQIKEGYFYIFDKVFDIFIGVGIKFEELYQLSNKIKQEINKNISPLIFKFVSLYIFLILFFYLLVFFYFRKKIELVEKIFNRYKESAIKDQLLNIYNREGFKIYYQYYKTLLIADLDNFKYINDTFGHHKGDELLITFSNLLKSSFKNELIGRWGGDEFLIGTNKSKEEIKTIFKHINKKLLKFQKNFDELLVKKVSCSVGGCEENLEFEKKFEKADLALYKSKKLGKGIVTFYKEIKYIRIEKE